MERILSKEEISELLASIREGEIPVEAESGNEPAAEGAREAPTPKPKAAVARFDLIQGGARAFELENFDLILDGFARNFSITLTNRLQRSVTVKRASIEMLEFDQFVTHLSGYSSLAVLRIDPLRWGGLIAVEDRIAFPVVELLLGASDDDRLVIPNRGLTTIELSILKSVLNDACLDMAKAFDPIEKLDISLIKMESNPRMVNIVPPETMVVRSFFRISLSNLSGKFSLMIPRLSLEPLRDKLKDSSHPDSRAHSANWKAHITEGLLETEALVQAQLAQISISLKDILNLRVGDVIDLGRCQADQLRILVEGKGKFLGVSGIRNGNKAVRITAKIRKEEKDGRK